MTGSTVATIDPTPHSVGEEQSREKTRRKQFANYFAGEDASRGLIKFKTPIKRGTIWLGAVLWSLTIPISLYQAYKILEDDGNNHGPRNDQTCYGDDYLEGRRRGDTAGIAYGTKSSIIFGDTFFGSFLRP